MEHRRRPLLFVFFIIVLCSILGGVFGPGLQPVSAADGPEEDLKASIKQFTKVFEVVEENFADKVTSDKAIYKGSIPGMLRTRISSIPRISNRCARIRKVTTTAWECRSVRVTVRPS